jgi:hypothetical protein
VILGGADYRDGALERLQESEILLIGQSFSGSIYLAGRSVEGMLRALIWRRDVGIRQGKKSLETGHDLRELLVYVRNLGLLRAEGRDDRFEAKVQRVGRLWSNDLRFAPIRIIEARWKKAGEVTNKRSLKLAAKEYFEDCSTIIKRCEVLWQS